MARKWENQDSARTMKDKYNSTAEEVENLKRSGKEINQATQDALDELDEKIGKKIETKEDIGLGHVDNTADEDKPVSNPQRNFVERAVEDMITSEPASEDFTEETEETGFITSISVSGTKLIISI